MTNPSVVCLSSVTFVGPTQAIETFEQYFFAILYFSHPLTSERHFTQIAPEELLPRGR